MSLTNLIVGSAEILFVTDLELDHQLNHPDLPPGPMPGHKVWPLPALDGVLFGRGVVQMIRAVGWEFGACVAGFDWAAEHLGQFLLAIAEDPATRPPVEDPTEVFLAGYSPAADAMRCRYVQLGNGRKVEGWCRDQVMAPGYAELGAMPTDRASLVDYTARQQALFRQRHPGRPGGGPVALGTLRRDFLSIERLAL